MHADAAFLDLRLRRRSLLGYTLGMAFYALAIVVLYPSFKDCDKSRPTHEEWLHGCRALRAHRIVDLSDGLA